MIRRVTGKSISENLHERIWSKLGTEQDAYFSVDSVGNKEFLAKAGFKTIPGWSYRDMWWVSHNEHGAFAARGVHGQAVYVDTKAEMVIARFASYPLAANSNLDPTTLPAFHALAKLLME